MRRLSATTPADNIAAGVVVNVNGTRAHNFRRGLQSLGRHGNHNVSMAAYGRDLYGSNGDYTSCSIEYVRPLTD